LSGILLTPGNLGYVKSLQKSEGDNSMGLLDDAEKLAGAVVAVEGAKKLDPDASILTEGAAAVAGFEGAGAISNFLKNKEEGSEKS
jgi:hypothetical protein